MVHHGGTEDAGLGNEFVLDSVVNRTKLLGHLRQQTFRSIAKLRGLCASVVNRSLNPRVS